MEEGVVGIGQAGIQYWYSHGNTKNSCGERGNLHMSLYLIEKKQKLLNLRFWYYFGSI
jgi:hypothetical protein